jgi:2-dehydropantoate 2-reductase
MDGPKIAVVGIGAIGSVLAAALLSTRPETTLVVSRESTRQRLLERGIEVSGVLSYRVPARRVVTSIRDLVGVGPDVVFLCTKTFSLGTILDELGDVFHPGMKIVSTQNGLGTEDLIVERFGSGAAVRMSMNYGGSPTDAGHTETTFFNRPNPLGVFAESNRAAGADIAALLTAGGLDTLLVDDIKLQVWKKMIMKCTMAPICAVTDRTIQSALDYAPTREIADRSFQEILAVAKAMGYDLGDDYLTQAMGYLEKVGAHKDSMCYDIAAKRPTEIDFLGGKVVEYAREKGVPAPFYTVMTNLVRALQDGYLQGATR